MISVRSAAPESGSLATSTTRSATCGSDEISSINWTTDSRERSSLAAGGDGSAMVDSLSVPGLAKQRHLVRGGGIGGRPPPPPGSSYKRLLYRWSAHAARMG